MINNSVLENYIKSLVLLEARRFDYKRHVFQALEKYASLPNHFIHYSMINKVGVYPRSRWVFTGAIYSFALNAKYVREMEECAKLDNVHKQARMTRSFKAAPVQKPCVLFLMPYIHIIKADDTAKFITYDELDEKFPEADKYSSRKLSAFVKSIGFDVVINDEYNSESLEYIFLTKKYKHVATFLNPMLKLQKTKEPDS